MSAPLVLSIISIAISLLTIAQALRARRQSKAAEIAAETDRTFAAIEQAKARYNAAVEAARQFASAPLTDDAPSEAHRVGFEHREPGPCADA